MSKKTATEITNNIQDLEEPPPSNLAVLISPHLQKLAKTSPAVRKQFYPCDKERNCSSKAFIDPLLEDQFIKTKGLIHKYPSRVLIELTLTCASYCRFCTRRRMVSDLQKLQITEKDIDNMIKYLKKHPEINEVIFSGGDPLTVPQTLQLALQKISKLPSIRILRIHTRMPISNPILAKPDLLNTIAKINKEKPIYLSLHFEHPDELTKETIKLVKKIRQTGAILLSQTVFLKGINDSYEVLAKLFTSLAQLGIRPYYIYHCDPVKGAEHFMVSFIKEIKIMTKIRANLSGIAYPTYVIDTPNGAGKIPVPLDFWKFEKKQFADFNGKKIVVR
ncbi:KamA family radical SAM protein [Candidatus Beckwithbacteria bacterium]|nr:KamA family radical SAM protein [Candidatus Beckwithbacteria bacterium]